MTSCIKKYREGVPYYFAMYRPPNIKNLYSRPLELFNLISENTPENILENIVMNICYDISGIAINDISQIDQISLPGIPVNILPWYGVTLRPATAPMQNYNVPGAVQLIRHQRYRINYRPSTR